MADGIDGSACRQIQGLNNIKNVLFIWLAYSLWLISTIFVLAQAIVASQHLTYPPCFPYHAVMTEDQEVLLPPYPGVQEKDILLVQTPADAEQAYAEMQAADILGFDTESKPVFFKGQQSDGPHLIQLATDTKAYLFPTIKVQNTDAVKALLESKEILKVGFGLSDDMKRLKIKLGISPQHVLDLARAMRESKQRDMGAKAAVAKYFGMQLQKSKKTSTSNWATPALNDRQIMYAANDAQVALLVYRKWLALK